MTSTRRNLPVTDHAVLRYLERVVGFDVNMVRKHIADETQAGRNTDAPCVYHNGVRYLIANGEVVTVLAGGTIPRHGFLIRLMASTSMTAGGVDEPQ